MKTISKEKHEMIEGSGFSGRVQEEKRKSIENMFYLNHLYQRKIKKSQFCMGNI
jgi:hypothetical protein